MGRFDIKHFLVDSGKIEEDLIILLSVFHANSNNQSKLEPLFKAGKIFGYFVTELNLIEQKLISSAINLRMIDDRFNVKLKKVKLHYSSVGHISTSQKNATLSFREACNKIVHANSVHLNTKKHKVDQPEILEEFITVKGIKGNDLWTATIDIERFVVNGLCLIKFYDDDWDVSSRN